MIGRHELNELAPRDIVAREIYKEIKAQKLPYVKLDITHESEEFLKKRFPTIYNKCLEMGIDISKQFIPVGPVQHYMMGGIETDLEGLTNIKGLYAIGEAANTGVHGANRLASNSTLECVVFGRRCAHYINEHYEKKDIDILYYSPKYVDIDIDIEHEIIELKGVMVKYCGIVRNEYTLNLGLTHIKELLKRLENVKLETVQAMELYNMALVAYKIVEGAIQRKESIGSHYREDDNNAK
jgi:L-aspartate oxidase